MAKKRPTEAPMTLDRTPDAIMAPASEIQGSLDIEQAARATYDRAKALLGVPRAFIRDQGDVRFITGSPYDTINEPKGSPREGLPRYTWEDIGAGWKAGYLTEDAKRDGDTSED